METTIKFSPSQENTNDEVQQNSLHSISVTVDASGNYTVIEAATREALFEFGRALMENALFGSGGVEFYPLISNGKPNVVNGVRLTESSARVFVYYPSEGEYVA